MEIPGLGYFNYGDEFIDNRDPLAKDIKFGKLVLSKLTSSSSPVVLWSTARKLRHAKLDIGDQLETLESVQIGLQKGEVPGRYISMNIHINI
jgi:hypothetical protein